MCLGLPNPGVPNESPVVSAVDGVQARAKELFSDALACARCSLRITEIISRAADAMARSRAPVVFSHSNPRALWAHERNIADEQARACALTGGVVGINGISAFLGADDTRTTTLADHTEYLLDLLGADHVGLGLDYFFEPDEESGFNEVMANQAEYWPPDQYPGGEVRAAQPCQLYDLTEILLRRNHTDVTVKAILGGNFKRVADQVWGS